MELENKTKSKSKFKFAKKIIFVIIIGLLISVITYFAVDYVHGRNIKESYYKLSSVDIDELFEISNDKSLLFDAKAYNKFESICLGNKNSNLLSYGNYCEKEDFICKSKDKTVLLNKGKEIAISKNPSSYINIIDGCIYYRDDITRLVYKYSISSGKNECVIDEPCGEVVVSAKGISYIDSKLNLNYMDFDTSKKIKISNDEIKSFCVVGNLYYCLKNNGDFGVINQKGSFKPITTDAEHFFCDGKIAIQKGSNIYIVDRRQIADIEPLQVEGVLVGFCDDKIYVNEEDKVNSYIASTLVLDKTIVEFNSSEILKSFYISNNTYEIITYKDADSQYVEKHRSIEKIDYK